MRYTLNSLKEDEIQHVANLYKEFSEGNLSNYFTLENVVKGTQNDILQVAFTVFGGMELYTKLLRREAELFLRKEGDITDQTEQPKVNELIDDVLDHPIERSFLRLETGVKALLKSNEFSDFTQGKSTLALKFTPRAEWEKLIWKAHFGDMSNVDKELLINLWLEESKLNLDTEQPHDGYEEKGLTSIRDIIRDAGGFSSADGIEKLHNMNNEQWQAFMASYHPDGVPQRMSPELNKIVDFITYAYMIKTHSPKVKAA